MCHADLIGSGTTSRDLRALKMFLFNSVCFRRDNEAPLVERVKALWSKTISPSRGSRTKRNRSWSRGFRDLKETWNISLGRWVLGFLQVKGSRFYWVFLSPSMFSKKKQHTKDLNNNDNNLKQIPREVLEGISWHSTAGIWYRTSSNVHRLQQETARNQQASALWTN